MSQVSAVGSMKLLCKSWLPRRFQVGTQVTKQPVNICDYVDRFYLTKTGCMELKCFTQAFQNQ